MQPWPIGRSKPTDEQKTNPTITFPCNVGDHLWYVDKDRQMFEVEVYRLEAQVDKHHTYTNICIHALLQPFTWDLPVKYFGVCLFSDKVDADKLVNQCCGKCTHCIPVNPMISQWDNWAKGRYMCTLSNALTSVNSGCDKFFQRPVPVEPVMKIDIPDTLKEDLKGIMANSSGDPPHIKPYFPVDWESLIKRPPGFEKLDEYVEAYVAAKRVLVDLGQNCTNCKHLGRSEIDGCPTWPTCGLKRLEVKTPLQSICECYEPTYTPFGRLWLKQLMGGEPTDV